MAFIKVVPTDLRKQFMTKTTPGPADPEVETGPLSFSKLQVLLKRAKPHSGEEVLVKDKPDPSLVARRLSLQEQHHFERMNLAKSVHATSANDGVLLSARSRLG